MTNVITAKIVYADCDNRIWREIQMSENSFLCQLGYTVLATFDTMAYHMFSIKHGKTTYDLPDEDIEIEPDECLFCVKLSELNLKVGDKLEMVYDFGCEQVFDIEIDNALLKGEIGEIAEGYSAFEEYLDL